MTGEPTTRIAIVGAGLAGGLLACLLAEAGYEISVYERRPDPRKQGFVGGRSINLALSARGIHALQRAGLAEAVLADAIPMRGRMIHSPAGGLSFQPYSKSPSDAINSVSRGGLNLALVRGAERYDNVHYHFEHRCVEVDLDAPSVRLETGAGETITVETDVVIGCDGAFSVVRGQMQREDRFNYSQTYLEHGYKELTVPPTRDGEYALAPNALHIWPRGGSMMIALPNPDRSFTCTLFWPFAGANSFAAVQTDEDVRRFFEAHFPDAVPLMPTLAEDYQRNPIGSLVTVRCAPWFHGDKVVLVGDAAHAIVPFYGQGINAGFEGVVALAECLRQQPSDRQGAFEAYFRQRKVNTDAIADLAVANFLEMRDRVASPAFRLKKKTQRVLHRVLPGVYTPLYNMVTFTRIPYAEARRRAERAEAVLRVAGWIVLIAVLLFVLGVLWGPSLT
ncbi:MAG: FAD-dependent oxidoreductase [Planctomycetota bacterium]